ncbi:unnamed protein product [Closterium sp. Naga37s-1]|nr:unnamed protein product [Closterium sp. Naga37s-1]
MAAVATRALASAPVALEATRQRLVAGKALRSAVPAVTAVRGQRLVARASLEKPTRQTYFASPQSLSYLDGTLPGDFGFDPLGLSDPEGAGNFIDPKWLTYGELINGRWAMLGVAGMIAPEILGSYGIGPKIVWFQSGVIPPLGGYEYWADPYALFVLEIVLIGFAEHRRAQDYYKPGYGSKQYLLGLEKVLGGSGDPIYPGGPVFNFAGLGKTEAEMHTYKTKEVRNSRLAMLAALGFFFQAWITGVGPLPGDYGFDPLGLSDPEGAGAFVSPRWLAYAEVVHARWAMLGALGMIAPEMLGDVGVIPARTGVEWFRSGVIPPIGAFDYWADPYTLFVAQAALLAFTEHRRAQDYYAHATPSSFHLVPRALAAPGYGATTPFFGLERLLGGSKRPAYPGGPFFNFARLGRSKAEMRALRTAELKHGRVAMAACAGCFAQAVVTGSGPWRNVVEHVADPAGNNLLALVGLL